MSIVGPTGSVAIGIGGTSSGSATVPAYDPGMMTFDGTNDWYEAGSLTMSGNKETVVVRFNSTAPDEVHGIIECNPGTVEYWKEQRVQLIIIPDDYATVNLRSKIQVNVESSSQVVICKLISTNTFTDGADHVVMFSFDGDLGTAQFIIDGVDEDDTGHSARVAPAIGVLANVATINYGVGALVGGLGTSRFGGSIGYVGYSSTYITNHADFMDGSIPKEIDEVTWTEWGAQPLFWNTFGTMTDNKGSAGNMTANGTITGPE